MHDHANQLSCAAHEVREGTLNTKCCHQSLLLQWHSVGTRCPTMACFTAQRNMLAQTTLRPNEVSASRAVAAKRGLHVKAEFNLDRAAGKLKQSLDFNKPARIKVIDQLYRSPSRQKLESVLADSFKMGEEGYSRKFSKSDYIGLMCDSVLPAIPDFTWGHATNGEVDNDGWCIVTVQATGHHSGGPLLMPGLEALPPSGKHFCLAEEVQKVKVEGAKVAEIEVLPNKGAGPRALYQALGGKLPAPSTAAPAAPPMP